MAEIWPAEMIPLTAPLDSDALPIDRFESRLVKGSLVPDFLKQFF